MPSSLFPRIIISGSKAAVNLIKWNCYTNDNNNNVTNHVMATSSSLKSISRFYTEGEGRAAQLHDCSTQCICIPKNSNDIQLHIIPNKLRISHDCSINKTTTKRARNEYVFTSPLYIYIYIYPTLLEGFSANRDRWKVVYPRVSLTHRYQERKRAR